MPKWSRDKVDPNTINNGNELDSGSQVALQELNAIVNSGLYAQDFATNLASDPDVSEADNVGVATVKIVDIIKDDRNYKKFKFINLKGKQGEQGIQGKQGEQGIQGEQGAGIASITANGQDSNGGNIYKITLTNGSTYTFTAPKGSQGEKGQEIEIRVNGSNLEYKYENDTTWTILANIRDFSTNPYPVGSIYMSVNSTDPSTLFGGTWERFANGRVIVGVDEDDPVFMIPERTGGSKALQKHTHTFSGDDITGTFKPLTGGADKKYAVSGCFSMAGNYSASGVYNNAAGNAMTATFSATPSGVISETGTGDGANLQPYITCYIWVRVA